MWYHRPEHFLGGGTPWQFGKLPETLILFQTKIPGGWGYSWEFLVGVSATQFSSSWPNFRPKNVIFHTRFSTRSLKFTNVFTPGLWAEIMLSLLGLEWKQKNSSKPFQIRIFLSLSHSFGLKKKIRSYIPELPSKTILDSRPKWAKCIPVFRPKRRKNPTRWGGTYLYKGVSPARDQNMSFFFYPIS